MSFLIQQLYIIDLMGFLYQGIIAKSFLGGWHQVTYILAYYNLH